MTLDGKLFSDVRRSRKKAHQNITDNWTEQPLVLPSSISHFLLLIVCILNQQLVAKDCKTTKDQSDPDTTEELPTVDE